LAATAAVLLTLGLAPYMAGRDVAPAMGQALVLTSKARDVDSERTAVHKQPARFSARQKRSRPVVPEPEIEIEIEPESQSSVLNPPPPRSRPQDERQTVLLEQAQRQWRAGNIEAAEKTLRTVIRGGRRSLQAQNAYADLFAIAHRHHGPATRGKLWRSYLQRFPRGRYADDARAGLCRLTEGATRVTCWEAYLREFPAGSYRVEAERSRAER
jgi:hypothetical protein